MRRRILRGDLGGDCDSGGATKREPSIGGHSMRFGGEGSATPIALEDWITPLFVSPSEGRNLRDRSRDAGA